MTELDHRIRTYLAATFHFSDEQLDQMQPGFLDTLRGHLAALERAVSEDPKQLIRAAHTMKGALLNLGLEDEAAIVLELEERGTNGSAASSGELVTLLRQKLVGL